MKNKLWSMLAGSFLAMALGISSANAFVIDTKLAEAMLSDSGDATELTWIQTVTGDATLALDFKINFGDPGFNVASNGPDSWFIDVAPQTPGYFMLKFGTGGTTASADHFLFTNIAELTKLVWSNNDVQNLTGGDCGANNQSACNIGRLSHFVGTGSSGGSSGIIIVPEPGILALIGLGLLAQGGLLYRRRLKQS